MPDPQFESSLSAESPGTANARTTPDAGKGTSVKGTREASAPARARVRFAPSPTGDPHVGNIRTALFDWLFARHTGGVFVLRIEDTDTAREQQGSAAAICEHLRWLGLNWDEGPEVGGPHAPYFQSQRLHLYRPLIQKLLDEGKAYRCYCTPERLAALREEQQLNKQATGYDRHCRNLPLSELASLDHSGLPYTVRLKMPLEGVTRFTDRLRGEIVIENSTRVDPVLVKSNGMPLYHFAAVVDDHLMGITHVLRSEEWISSAPIHYQLYEAFGWTPPEIIHLPLVTDMDGRKLGKRKGHAGLLVYRKEGYLPEALANFLALLGWSPGDDREIMPRDELVAAFSLEGLLSHSARFDRAKLDWMNGQYLRMLPLQQLFDKARPFLEEAGLLSANASEAEVEYACRVLRLEQARIQRLRDTPALTRFFFVEAPEIEEKARRKWIDKPETATTLERFLGEVRECDRFEHSRLEASARRVAESMGVSAGQVFHPVRVAVSGRTEGPGLFEMLEVLGKERVIRRLERALALSREWKDGQPE